MNFQNTTLYIAILCEKEKSIKRSVWMNAQTVGFIANTDEASDV